MSNPNPPQDTDRLIYAGFLGLSVAAIVQFIEAKRADLDWQSLIAVVCFSVAIPLLAVGFVNEYTKSQGIRISFERTMIAMTGCVASVAGLAALFFHIAWEAGVLFCLFVVVAFFAIKRT